tara:strand:- start:249 stop:1061 length:813 start_codon:yes stop_codon:yes gene_type:complete
MSVSFIIPVWEKTTSSELFNSLQSLETNTELINEFIIVFDGYKSFDLEIKFPPNIKDKINYIYIWNNKGPGISRNIGVIFSKSKYIFFLDSGDRCLPNRVKTQLIDLINKGVSYGLIQYNTKYKNYFSKPVSTSFARLILPFRNPYPNVCLAIKKDIFIKLKGYPSLRTGEDWVLAGKILKFFDYVPFSNSILVETDIIDIKKNLVFRRYGVKILKRLISAHYKMFLLNLYNRMFFPIAILYQVFLRLMPFKIFKFIYNMRLKFLFNKTK